VVERDCVTVLNNEMGFQEHNIRAICDVGRSTKGKHKYGYIGTPAASLLALVTLLLCAIDCLNPRLLLLLLLLSLL